MDNFLQFVAYVGLLLILLYLNLQLELNNDENNTRIFNEAQKILIILTLGFLIVGIVVVLFMRKWLWNIVNRLNEIDNQV